jgi:hypothetical protein
MTYNNTNVSSRGMTLKEAKAIIHQIESNYGLGYMNVTEEKIGKEVKFVKFEVSIKIDNGVNGGR